ncbi:MAG TPA: hypothetical protein VIM06_02060 [Rhodanobacter sp.]
MFKFLLFLFGFLTSGMVFGQAWYLRSSYQEIYDRALVVSVTTLGGEYEHQLNGERMNKPIATIFAKCARSRAQANAAVYTVVGIILSDGKMVNPRTLPSNDVAICLSQGIRALAFPLPPAESTPYAVAFRFDGKTMRRVSPFPSFDHPPPPPSY